MKSPEFEAAGILLDIGVSVPLKSLKIPFRRKRLTFRLTMKRPCYGNLIRIARLYLQTGVTAEQMAAFSKEDEMAFIARHGKEITRIVALTICRGFVSGWLLAGLLAWFIRWFVPPVFITGAMFQFVRLLNIMDFQNIIRLAETINPLKPRLSQRRKRS